MISSYPFKDTSPLHNTIIFGNNFDGYALRDPTKLKSTFISKLKYDTEHVDAASYDRHDVFNDCCFMHNFRLQINLDSLETIFIHSTIHHQITNTLTPPLQPLHQLGIVLPYPDPTLRVCSCDDLSIRKVLAPPISMLYIETFVGRRLAEISKLRRLVGAKMAVVQGALNA